MALTRTGASSTARFRTMLVTAPFAIVIVVDSG
jgi:hypothetical protein